MSRTTNTITLPNRHTKLSDKIDFLPNGLINKKLTGIGATYCEMHSKRHSIIVTPTRALAYNKAHKDTKFLYVGSPYDGERKVTNKDIEEYLDDSEVEYKKILVVADSLKRVIDLLVKRGEKVSKTYFFMVDEIDTLQSDNYFRPLMSKVLDYYFEFSKKNRALVSATVNEFSHPKLKNEPVTCIECEEPLVRNIALYYNYHVNLMLSDVIQSMAEEHPQDKILIAYNSIQNILKTIKLLPEDLQDRCGILCSEVNKLEAGHYMTKINPDNDTLPSKHSIVFMTCAYFTGIDIADKCHLITVSNVHKAHSVLSLNKITQIYGRLRQGVLSDTLIYNIVVDKNKEINCDINAYPHELLKNAKELMSLLDNAGNIMKDEAFLSRIRKLIIDRANGDVYNLFPDSTVSLVRKDKDKRTEIAYFNIDALVEKMKTFVNLYHLDKKALPNKLEEAGHIINTPRSKYYSDEEVAKSKKKAATAAKEHLKRQYEQGLTKKRDELLRLIDTGNLEDKSIMRLIGDAQGKEADYLWKFRKLCPYVDAAYLVDALYEVCLQNSKAYRSYNNALYFHILDDKHPFKMQVLDTFGNWGRKYSSKEISELLLPVIKYHFLKGNVSQSSLVNLFKNIYKHTYTQGKYIIRGLNPRVPEIPPPLKKLQLEKSSKEIEDLNNYFDIPTIKE